MALVGEWATQTGSTAVNTISLTPPTTPNQAIALAISVRASTDTFTVSGGGLTWTKQLDQCSARNNYRTELHTAYGTPNGTNITITFSDATGTRTVSARSWLGADPTTPFAAAVGRNTLGVSGACTGGTDNATATATVTSTVPGSCHFIVTTSRATIANASEDVKYRRLFLIGDAGVTGERVIHYMHERFLTSYGAGAHTITNTINAATDWVTVGIAVQPATAPPTAVSFGTGDIVTTENFAYSDGSLWDAAAWDGPFDVDYTNLSVTSGKVTVASAVYRDAYTVEDGYGDGDYILDITVAPTATADASLDFYIGALYENELFTGFKAGYGLLYNSNTDLWEITTLRHGAILVLDSETQVIADASKIGWRMRGSDVSTYYHNGTSWAQIGSTMESGMFGPGRIAIASRATSLQIERLEVRALTTAATNIQRRPVVMRQAVKRASTF